MERTICLGGADHSPASVCAAKRVHVERHQHGQLHHSTCTTITKTVFMVQDLALVSLPIGPVLAGRQLHRDLGRGRAGAAGASYFQQRFAHGPQTNEDMNVVYVCVHMQPLAD